MRSAQGVLVRRRSRLLVREYDHEYFVSAVGVSRDMPDIGIYHWKFHRVPWCWSTTFL
jgi:hypothetical protein